MRTSDIVRSGAVPLRGSVPTVAGSKKPFAITSGVIAHVNKFAKSKTTQLQKAIALFTSIIPSNYGLRLNDGKKYFGISGGLEMPNSAFYHPGKSFVFSAEEAFKTPSDKRVATCLGYSLILIPLLRAAGISAGIKEEGDHVYVIATLGGKRHKLDVAQLKLEPTREKPNTDREAMTMYYCGRGAGLAQKKAFEEALRHFNAALRLNPFHAMTWYNKGNVYTALRRWPQAIRCYREVLKTNPENNLAKAGIANAYLMSGQFEKGKALVRRLEQSGVSFTELLE